MPPTTLHRPSLTSLLLHPPRLRYLLTTLLLAFLLTILTAWSCILWSPQSWQSAPQDNPLTAPNLTDPDGTSALFYHSGGLGWSELNYAGQRFPDHSIWWRTPHGEYPTHRLAGFPLPALRSRVLTLDNDQRVYENEPPSPPPRTRWQLPLSEILHRGLNTSDLPAFLHARPNRRIPLIPMPLGLALNTLLYALLLHLLASLTTYLHHTLRPHPRGFEPLQPPSSPPALSHPSPVDN